MIQEHDAGVMIALPKRSLGLGTARQMTRIIVFLQYSKVDTWISITVNGIHPMRGFLLPIRWQSWLKIIPTWHRSRVHNSRSPSSWLSVAWYQLICLYQINLLAFLSCWDGSIYRSIHFASLILYVSLRNTNNQVSYLPHPISWEPQGDLRMFSDLHHSISSVFQGTNYY